MAFKKIPLTIDTMIRNPVPVEGINQEDNIELNIVVTENKTPKDLSSQTIKVYVRRIDGTLVEQTDQITPTNASKGEVTVKLKNSAFNKEGYALFQLDISDSSGRITSSYATFKIGKGLVSGEAIANTNEIEALKKVEEYIKKANQELETFKQTVAEINENEATRQENEVVRVKEETSRNEAEAIRAQQEATRKEKENERVQAEIQRIADEEVRRENEALRGSKELERKQAEELRKEKELLRIADENNRKVAESKRIEAESVRVEAEKLRVVAETGRVEAESLRVTAEEERVAAETKREEEFNAFEGKINANTEELKNARSATTGEVFDTLDERIDHEVDRLNKKIDVTMLQQEDKESHTIENTVDGMSTDVVVKGKTLQNLVDVRKMDLGDSSKEITFENDIIKFRKTGSDITYLQIPFLSKPNTTYTIMYTIVKNTVEQPDSENYILYPDGVFGDFSSTMNTFPQNGQTGLNKFCLNTKSTLFGKFSLGFHGVNIGAEIWIKDLMILEYLKDLQIEEETQSTSYKPYKCDKKDILLQDLGFDEGLRGFNSTVCDELNDIKNVAIKRVGKKIITSELPITLQSINVHGIANFAIPIDDLYKDRVGFCNKLILQDTLIADTITEGFTLSVGARGAFIRVKSEKASNVEEFKQYLATLNEPIVIYYPCEPVETPLDESIALKVFNEKTYVSFKNSISGTSSFKAPVNATATISHLNRENRALEEENKKLRQDFESTTLTLTDSDLELVKQNVDMDFRLMEVEFALDIPQSTLSSNINFKKKGEVKSMARTPYEMMKIVILSGDYDREDYMHKVGKYYERGRMTKEEHDELMSLMTADEVIGG
ncbi:virion structural protein [Clostridium phage phiCP39-O]|uniref:virion structural protein n=1 Tax=Clostridium phage phiCP39-O TaxID=541865 RepID=UPI000181BE76|nr:virion structural protein [Clostridium phage phiCP39-O]ACE81997.1 pre-neck/exonuclease [Clostridium phage phiCP39-O]